nr:Cupin domain protein [uncultured bacterium]
MTLWRRVGRAAAVVALIAGCGHPESPRPTQPGPGNAASAAVETSTLDRVPIDAQAPSQDERLAAIQKAMNELDEAAQVCWAAAAVERFDIEGEIVATIDIAPTSAQVTFARDTARNAKLSSCLARLLSQYRWAPPLHGQAIQLPFKFRAPDGQNVIDRALVPWNGQGKLAVAVLLDEHNTGNDSISMFELALEAGGTTGLRYADRAELWYFLGPATIQGVGGLKRAAVAAGDMMYARAGVAREVIATTGPVHAMVAVVPGGREGSARAGALPTREANSARSAPPPPLVLPAAAAKTYSRVTIFAEPATIKDKLVAASLIEMGRGVTIPEHVHAGETEALYVLSGAGTMTINGVAMAVTPTSVVQIPPNTKHSFTAASDLRAVQIYTPAGPEQRFKARP